MASGTSVSSVSDAIFVRPVQIADADIVAHHRVSMFRDMGSVGPESVEALRAASRVAVLEMIPRGEYVGWLATPTSEPGRIVAGAGVQLRRVLPFPKRGLANGDRVAPGRQAIVLNVYTERDARRQGYARRLMEEVIAWARGAKIDSLVLHAAPDGRALYESLGFSPTNEMRYVDEL